MKKRIFVMLIALLCVFLTACNSSDYKKAETLVNQGNYSDAIKIYEALDGYADSQDKVNYCKYEIGEQLFEEEQYEEALDLFLSLGSYNGSDNKVVQCKYELGKRAYNEQDWDRAIEFLDELRYMDSQGLLASANKEKGMTEKADYEFLETLRQSVEKRLNDTSKDDFDRLNLVNTELTFLNKFRNVAFYDKKVKEMASLYLKGLDKQKKAFNYDDNYLFNEVWLEGMVDRYTALNTLYEKYDFMSDSPEFISAYIADFDKTKADYTAILAIDKDILKNLNDLDSFSYLGPHSGYAIFKNNTNYTFDIVFEFTIYNQDETQVLHISQCYVERIKPGNEYKLTVDYGNNSGSFRIHTDWTIISAKK